ncbi:MAG: glycosyltransferase family 4 protein [Lachnospiraceae bacterium]|nr:glycosyltransferase family 4 protein [Lachnospiraceae bacterium]
MKILVVCQYYYPESFKVTDVCEALVKNGHNVTVLTGLPNYPTGIVPDEYKGNKKRDETINGVHVIRCYERGRKKGAINLAINYASFYFFAMRLIKKMDKDFDIVFSYQLSPVFMALPARWYKRKRHVPMFLYCSDLWPESLKVYVKGESNPIFKWVKSVSRKVYQSADRIATQSDIFVDYLKDVHGIDEKKLSHIPNFADEEYLSMDFTPDDNTVDIVFMGNVGVAQNLEDVVRSFKSAIEQIGDKNLIKLHIVGGGVRLDDIKKLVKELGIEDSVKFYGQRPQEEMPDFYKIADACIVSLKADNMIGLTFPAKVQGYMAAKKPVLGMIDGSCKKVINEASCGICVSAGDIKGFSDAIVKFSMEKDKWTEYGINSKNYFLKHFRKDIHVKAIEEELKRCIKDV